MKYKVVRPIRDKFGNKVSEGQVVNRDILNETYLQRLISNGRLIEIEEMPLERFEGTVKPCIVTGMWKRPEVFKLFGEHYQSIGIDVIVVGSEGKQSKDLAESFGFIYLEHPNSPLGSKMNATITEAMKRDYTHVICVGSDDLLSLKLIDYQTGLMQSGYDFIGMTDFYFYELKSGKASYWGGYREPERRNHTVGAGRCLSRRIINSWGGVVWDNSKPKQLDTVMQNRLSVSKYPQRIFSLKEKGMFAVDIKSNVNMTPFRLWDNSHYINSQIITDKFDVRNSSSN
jgi:hypothetical protein